VVADYGYRVPRAFQETLCGTNVEWNEERRCRKARKGIASLSMFVESFWL